MVWLGAKGSFWMPVPTHAIPRSHALSHLSYESSPRDDGLDIPISAVQFGSIIHDATCGFAFAAGLSRPGAGG